MTQTERMPLIHESIDSVGAESGNPMNRFDFSSLADSELAQFLKEKVDMIPDYQIPYKAVINVGKMAEIDHYKLNRLYDFTRNRRIINFPKIQGTKKNFFDRQGAILFLAMAFLLKVNEPQINDVKNLSKHAYTKAGEKLRDAFGEHPLGERLGDFISDQQLRAEREIRMASKNRPIRVKKVVIDLETQAGPGVQLTEGKVMALPPEIKLEPDKLGGDVISNSYARYLDTGKWPFADEETRQMFDIFRIVRCVSDKIELEIGDKNKPAVVASIVKLMDQNPEIKTLNELHQKITELKTRHTNAFKR